MENADAWRGSNPWTPMSNPLDIKHIGKLLEELGECVEATKDLRWGKLQDELADVRANICLVNNHFKLVDPPQFVRSASYLVGDLGNLIAAASRCLIQGIDECEPVTLRSNRLWLEEAIGRLINSMDNTIEYYKFDRVVMYERIDRKIAHLRVWHAQAVQ